MSHLLETLNKTTGCTIHKDVRLTNPRNVQLRGIFANSEISSGELIVRLDRENILSPSLYDSLVSSFGEGKDMEKGELKEPSNWVKIVIVLMNLLKIH